jgi:hypothetical protein
LFETATLMGVRGGAHCQAGEEMFEMLPDTAAKALEAMPPNKAAAMLDAMMASALTNLANPEVAYYQVGTGRGHRASIGPALGSALMRIDAGRRPATQHPLPRPPGDRGRAGVHAPALRMMSLRGDPTSWQCMLNGSTLPFLTRRRTC